jgi:hypothetical protein
MLCIAGFVAIGSHAAQKTSVPAMKTSLDEQFVGAVLPQIRNKFKGGDATDRQFQMLIEQASREYRGAHPNATIEPDKFVRYVAEGFGFLSIHTDPTGASVRVNGRAWDDLTDIDNNGTLVGEKIITVSKPGFEDETGRAEVSAGNFTLFYRKLKKKSN